MRVVNIHQTELSAPFEQVGRLIDSLASDSDRLWPRAAWPPMRLDRPLQPGAAGGHGPIRYTVEAYEPGRSVRFRFTAPRGFHGWHAFRLEDAGKGRTRLAHELRMMARGSGLLSWLLVFRPLHDAVIEDALAGARAELGLPRERRAWTRRVRLLRWLLKRVARAPRARSSHATGPV